MTAVTSGNFRRYGTGSYHRRESAEDGDATMGVLRAPRKQKRRVRRSPPSDEFQVAERAPALKATYGISWFKTVAEVTALMALSSRSLVHFMRSLHAPANFTWQRERSRRERACRELQNNRQGCHRSALRAPCGPSPFTFTFTRWPAAKHTKHRSATQLTCRAAMFGTTKLDVPTWLCQSDTVFAARSAWPSFLHTLHHIQAIKPRVQGSHIYDGALTAFSLRPEIVGARRERRLSGKRYVDGITPFLTIAEVALSWRSHRAPIVLSWQPWRSQRALANFRSRIIALRAPSKWNGARDVGSKSLVIIPSSNKRLHS
ncbi:hypothetical protein Bbelb_374070 [Branchiostoma belcheri]|nr:hypothetical protein Bbelb_374070 [Branchiostoma belcheri]